MEWDLLPNYEEFKKFQALRFQVYQNGLKLAEDFTHKFFKEVARITGFEAPAPRLINEQTKLRLFNLRIAMLEHKITLNDLVQIVVLLYRPRQFGHCFGWSIPVISGRVALGRIGDVVRSRFPNEENIRAWRDQQRQLQLAALRGHDEGPADSLENYAKRIQGMRGADSVNAKKLGKRPYLDNPWR